MVLDAPVSLHRPIQLGRPVACPYAGDRGMAAIEMLVPKAPMDENHLPQPWKHYVRRSWQVATINSKAVTQTVGEPPHQNLWLATSLTNSRHAPSHALGHIFEHFCYTLERRERPLPGTSPLLNCLRISPISHLPPPKQEGGTGFEWNVARNPRSSRDSRSVLDSKMAVFSHFPQKPTKVHVKHVSFRMQAISALQASI